MRKLIIPVLLLAVLGTSIAFLGCHMGSRQAARGEKSGAVAELKYARQDPVALQRELSELIAGPKGNEAELLIIERSGDAASPPQAPRGGELRTRIADREIALPLKHTDVKAQITMFVGAVTVTQQYHNPYDGKIEAVYVFPLPDDAAIRDFVMQIGERKIRGIIREREEARKIYLAAREQGHVASLLTQERANIFTQSVANIEPGKQIDIKITYFHALPYADGAYHFHFPMVVGPRFNPPGMKEGVGTVAHGATGTSGQKTEVHYLHPTEISAHDLSLEVDIDAGVPIQELSSVSHVIKVERPGPARVKVTLSPHDRIPNKDFVLRYKVAGKAVQAGLATFRDETGGYFALMLQPPAALADVPAAPREMVFVLDCSGSMDGEPIAAAKRALRKCLQRLGRNDTFQIVRFSDTRSSLGPKPVAATPENVRGGLRYLESLTSEGGTMMIHGIRAALDFPHDPERFRIVSFMTDGYIGNDREIIGEVKQRRGDSRVFGFGIGSSVNRYLIEGMSRVGRGVSVFVPLGGRSDEVAEEFYRRVEHPALTDIRIDWGGLAVTEAGPEPMCDLFVGRPVYVIGRFTGGGKAQVRVTGRVGGKPHETTLEVNLDEPGLRHAALPAIWARTRIAGLCDEMAWSSSPAEAQGAIKRLALQYGLMSEFTSFVAVDSSERTGGDHGTTIHQPVPMPDGVKYETNVKEK